jgi:hypothetical protein
VRFYYVDACDELELAGDPARYHATLASAKLAAQWAANERGGPVAIECIYVPATKDNVLLLLNCWSGTEVVKAIVYTVNPKEQHDD